MPIARAASTHCCPDNGPIAIARALFGPEVRALHEIDVQVAVAVEVEQRATLLHRLQLDLDVAVLATTAGLFDEFAFSLDCLADGFAVSHLRTTHVGFDLELALHTIDDDVEMQLAHARDNGLT